MPIQLLRIRVRGPGMPAAEGSLGGIRYQRGPAPEASIHAVLRLPHWWTRLRRPARADGHMRTVVLRLPFSRNVAVAFYGADIDLLCASVAEVGHDDAKTVQMLVPFRLALEACFRI